MRKSPSPWKMPGAGDRHHRHQRQQLGQEGQAGFRHRNDGLHQPDCHRDDQHRHQEDRRILGKQHHRGAGQFHQHPVIGHVPCDHHPPPKLLASDPSTSVQPSTETNSASFTGRLTVAGDTIIMPSAIRMLETIRSMTRNGR